MHAVVRAAAAAAACAPAAPAGGSAAPMSPVEMQRAMGLGINLGNVLEMADESASGKHHADERYFDAYKAANFSSVRVPVRWNNHTATTPPYAIDAGWMTRVATVLNWSLSRGLVTVVNVHHDDWLDDPAAFDAQLPRFRAIWQQVAARFSDADERLVFECFNEPYQMNSSQLNAMLAACLAEVRRTNPTRIVLISGLAKMGPYWFNGHPDALTVPDDPQLMLEIHSYDPYSYCGPHPTKASWGSNADRAAVATWMDKIDAWAGAHGLPLFLGEFGVTRTWQNASTGRVDWYEAHYAALRSRGWAATVWDDDGWFGVYDRAAGTWDAAVLAALGRVVPGAAAA